MSDIRRLHCPNCGMLMKLRGLTNGTEQVCLDSYGEGASGCGRAYNIRSGGIPNSDIGMTMKYVFNEK